MFTKICFDCWERKRPAGISCGPWKGFADDLVLDQRWQDAERIPVFRCMLVDGPIAAHVPPIGPRSTVDGDTAKPLTVSPLNFSFVHVRNKSEPGSAVNYFVNELWQRIGCDRTADNVSNGWNQLARCDLIDWIRRNTVLEPVCGEAVAFVRFNRLV